METMISCGSEEVFGLKCVTMVCDLPVRSRIDLLLDFQAA